MTQKKYYVDYYFAKDAIWKTDSNGEKQLDGYNTRSRYFVRLGNAINFYEKII